MYSRKNFCDFASVLLLIFVILIYFSGCEKFSSPTAPKQEDINRAGFIETSAGQKVQVLTFGDVKPSLRKVHKTEKWIQKDEGGNLELKFKVENSDDGELEVEIELKIHENSIPQDCKMAMQLDDEKFLSNLDVIFGPHDLQFSKAADLNIKIRLENMYLNGINQDDINVYYFNEEAGYWEEMDCEEILIEVNGGVIEKIEVINAKLPHFSRYALCKG
ncbi:MAG: hypothetical protein SCK70_07765 [bacterium]|nr:hypothetical protein [bacterium]